jgi:uncharacterized protein YoxC
MIPVAVLIIAIAFAVAVLALIPALFQLMRTLKSVESTLNDLNTSVKTLINTEILPLVNSLRNTVDEVNAVVAIAKTGVEKVEETVEEVTGTVNGINAIVDEKIRGSLIDAAAYLVGIKTGVQTLVENIRLRKKKEVA